MWQVLAVVVLWIAVIVARVAVEAGWAGADRRLLGASLIIMIGSFVALVMVL